MAEGGDPSLAAGPDRLARLYADRYGDRRAVVLNRSARLRADLFAGWLGRGRRLLEVGCGAGEVLACYAPGNRVVAMDIDREALEACRTRLGVETVWGDFTSHLPFEDGSFDAVVAGETLEHLPFPSLFLAEVRRVLLPGGLFVGSVPNAYHYRRRLNALAGRPFDPDPTHLRFFSLESLRTTLATALTVEEIVPIRGRWAHRWPSLFAHYLAWRCRRPAEGPGNARASDGEPGERRGGDEGEAGRH